MAYVNFKYQDEKLVYQPLINAVNRLCTAKGRDCLCISGYRSLEKQKIINADSLKQRKSQGAYQLPSGAVYTPDGKCWAAAYGASNHCYCIALDITDEWFKALTNTDLKPYGLIKPISYEPWHVQLLAHQGISKENKIRIRDNVLMGGGSMNEQEAKVDELDEAVKILAEKAGIDYDVWYKVAKDVKYLDKCFIKIARAFK